MRRSKPGVPQGTHTLKSTTTTPQPILQQQSIYPKLVFQIPCTPTLGTLHNQLSTLSYIFEPKFLPSKHKRPPLQPLSLTVKQKILSLDKRFTKFKDFVYTCCFPFFLSQSSITQSFPTQTAPALPNTVYAKVASGTKCSGLFLWNSQVAPNITNHFPLLKSLCPLFIGPCPPLIPTCGSSISSTFYPRLSSLFLRQSHILWRFACVALCQLLTDWPPTLTSSFPNEFPYQAVYLTSVTPTQGPQTHYDLT